MRVTLPISFSTALTRAVSNGLAGAALVDRDGNALAVAGVIADDEAMPIAALVMHRFKSEDLASRLFGGEIILLPLDDRDVTAAVAVAKRQLFVVGLVDTGTLATREVMTKLRDEVEVMLSEASDDLLEPMPWTRGSGGNSGSGPAELPLIELGVTVRRDRGKPN